MPDWESTFATWTHRASDSEEARCENAERAIREAIQASAELEPLDITVFAQGSWMANTNVKQDSDVDVCIRFNTTVYLDLPVGKTITDYNYTSATVLFPWYKDAVGRAMVSRFGAGSVTRGNKAFTIQNNSYRVHADAVPTFLYRDHKVGNGYLTPVNVGVAFDTDYGERVINYPEQALANGRDKNTRTGRAYKRAVRILKRHRNKLREEGIEAAKHNPSFQIESLLYNVDDIHFRHSTWIATMKAVIGSAFHLCADNNAGLKEVNGIKPLFGLHSSWTQANAQEFLRAVWNDFASQ